MFEREIQFIYDFNQNKVKRLGSFMTYEQLEETDVHPAILQYISGEIDFLIFEDRQKLLKESLFDYSGEKISEYFGAISGEIKRTKRFSLNYIEKLILHASSFTINYLSRPKWSILKFIFDEEKNKSALEIKQIFNYFYYYPYLWKIVLSYIDKKKVVSISFDEFKALLEKIDNISLESNHLKVISEALDSLSDFVNAGMSKRKLIPLQAIQYFLAEKSLDPFLAKLEQDFNNPEISRYELNDLKNSLKEVVFEVEGGSIQASEDPFMADDDFRPAKIDTFGEQEIDDAVEEPEPQEQPVENELPENIESEETHSLEDTVVPEIEPEDQTLDSPPLSYSDSDEIDLAEDTRGDGEVLEDLTEVVKEEKEELEIENLQKTESDIVPQGDTLDDDFDEDEFLEFEDKAEASEPVEQELDAAKALYMDEVIVEEAKEVVEAISEDEIEEETELVQELVEDEPEEAESELKQDFIEDVGEVVPELNSFDDEVESVPEEDSKYEHYSSYTEPEADADPEEDSEPEQVESPSVPETESPTDDNELDDALDDLVSEVEKVAENPVAYEAEPVDEDDVSIDELLDDVEELLDKNENDTEVGEFEDEIKAEDIPEFDSFAKEPDPVDLYKEEVEEVQSVPEEIVDEESEAEEDVFGEIESSGLLSNDSDFNDILGEEVEKGKSEEDLKLFDDKEFENGLDDEKDEINDIADELIGDEEQAETQPKKIDLGELLENKKMNKIIDSIFDYDMEDFANAIEKIIEAESEDEAHSIVDKICLTAQVSPTSKEAKLFKSIISEYYEQT